MNYVDKFLKDYGDLLRQTKGVDLTTAPIHIQESALAMHQKALGLYWGRKQQLKQYTQVRGPGGKLHKIRVWPRQRAIVLQDVAFSSTKMALTKDQLVNIEVDEDTGMTWVFDDLGFLLYTFGADKKPWKYVAFYKEKP